MNDFTAKACHDGRSSIQRKWLLTGATSILALAIADPAAAQTTTTPNSETSTVTIASPTQSGGMVQPAVAAPASTLGAREATTPQDNATSPTAPQGAPTAAQGDLPAADSEDIVVTGLRGSLQRNLDIKRTASGVVDAISAEDIGKFPDSNVAASLQRLPGVSIQRSGARGDATGITVRGFGGDFNTTLYDGRRISTGTGNRQIDFSTVGSDFIGQLSVFKTPDVTVSSNSIGATVDIQFAKPFDHPGFRIAATGSGSLQDRAKRVVPTGGFLVSDTFADDTIGVLADAIYTRRDTTTNRVFVAGWAGGYYAPCQLQGSTAANCAPIANTTANAAANPASQLQSIVGWFPQQYGAEQQRTKDERFDGRIALQWRPTEDLLFTLDNNFSRQTITTNIYGFGVWFNQGELRNVSLDDNGQVVNFTQAGSPTDFTSALNKEVLQTNQTGGNVKWDVTENLRIDGDLSYAKSWRNPDGNIGSRNGDIGYAGNLGTTTGLKIDGNSNNSFPTLTSFGPNGNAANFNNTALIGTHVTVNQTQKNTDVLKQGRLSATWKQDDLTIKAGGQYYDDTFRFQNSSTFTNNFWQAYAGYGAPSGRTTGIAPLPASLYQGTIGLNNFIPGFKGTLPTAVIKFSPVEYQNYLTSLGNPQTTTIPGFNNVAGFTGTFDEAVDPGSIQRINERTWSLFMSVDFETQIAGRPFHFNAGIRNENTHLNSTGQGRLPVTISPSDADPTLLTVSEYTVTTGLTTKSDYSYLLPSFDAKLEVTDTLQVRVDASRTLTRPGLNLLTPVLNVGVGQRTNALTATGGNPSLKPYLADNFDIAAEWYYRRNSYLSVDFFLKNVSNFIVGGVTRQTINGVIDPSTRQPAVFAVSQQVNGPDATVRGVEIALQHVFGETGFGFQANATLVNTNKPYDDQDISQSGFAVTGLANSANFVGFYDKNGFQFRAAVNWRDEYLLQFGQNQNTGQFGAEPTFVNASTQVDLSTSYDINKQFSVFGEALNINNAQYSTHGRFKNQLLDVFDYGRRFTIGARVRF